MDHILALRAFVRIAEAGSFAKAADSMNLPRSSVSKLLQDLEAHLGAKLVERTTRAVTVTTEGAAYLERAVRVLADIDDMDSTVAGGRAPRGRLRVDVGSSLANVLVIPALPSFQAAYPEIDLQLGISDRPVDLIGEGVDCVLRTGPLPDNTSLVARKLCELDWVTCASPAYLAGRELPQVPTDLERDHRIVAYFSAETGRQMPLRYIVSGEPIEIPVRASLSVNESTAHITTLAAGLGIGQTYGFMMRHEGDALVELLADFKPKKQVLHLVYPAGRFPSQKLRAFSDWIAGVCAAHGRQANSN